MVQTSLRARMMEAFRVRMFVYGSIVGVLFLIIVLQLFNLQVIRGEEYSIRSRLNMENNIPIPASRGEMYDRNFHRGSSNVIIVSNRPSFNLTTIPSGFETKEEMKRTMHNLSVLLNIPEESLIGEMSVKNPYERILLVEDVKFDAVVKIASHYKKFPNIDWEDAPVRVYNYGSMFSHMVGYIGSISGKEYRRLRKHGYKNYQKIGKSGIEREYDALLRGKDGFIRRIVDVRNRTEGEEVGQPSSAGNNVVLTVDYNVQKVAYDSLKNSKGGVVVLKPSTGEILSMVSKPDFDPNQIISKNNDLVIKELNGNKNRPFLNRPIQSKYPPASTFKLVTAISALETEKVYPDKVYYCPGKFTLKGYRDKDFYCYQAHGALNLYQAIAKSCSVYFYNLGYKIGPSSILKYANYFGLNEKTGIDLPGEVAGFLPSKKWKMKTFGQPWFDGDTINMSIGQGFLNITPMGMANFIAAIVNNGIVYRPHVLREIRSPDNSIVIKTMEREKIREIPLSPLSLNTVKTGMRMSVTGGTSIGLSRLEVPLAGKTGTAQTRSRRLEKYSQHAWFVGYGPYNAPPEKAVVVVVLVEYGIAGAVGAVPVAERIFSELYERGYFQ